MGNFKTTLNTGFVSELAEIEIVALKVNLETFEPGPFLI
jgi:hypothetical protein